MVANRRVRRTNRMMRRCSQSMCAAGALGAVFTTNALAQSPSPASAPGPSTGAVAAPSTSDQQGNAISEVVVTAERREGNAQKIPTAVQAVSATALQAANVQSVLDLGKLVPSALIFQNSGSVTTFLRGTGNNIVTVGNEPSNAVYIDGVYYSRLTSSVLRLDDIDRIEVLEGPQGTLFGRNATGGLIQLITKTPKVDSSPTFDISASYGSYNTNNSTLYMSTGLGQKAAADLALDYYNNPGFGRNVYDGSHANYEHAFNIRDKIVYEPVVGTSLTFGIHYEHSKSDIGSLAQYPGEPINGIGNTGLPLTGGLLPRVGYYDIDQDAPTFNQSESYGGNITLSQDVKFARLVDILAYNNDREVLASDTDYTPQPFKAAYLPSSTKTVTNELQLLSKSGSKIEWAVGFYYLHIDQGYDNGVLSGPGFGAPPPLSLISNASLPDRSYALYGQTTVPVYNRLKLTLGGRLSQDDLRGSGDVDVLVPPSTLIPAVPYDSTSHINRQFSWKAALSYDITDRILSYASVSHGYKAGLYNLLTFDPDYVKPEELTDYELGVKSTLLDGHVRLNGDIFTYKIHDAQAEVASSGLPALVNAREAQLRGAELQADAALFAGLSLKAGAALLDGRYSNYANAPFYTVGGAPDYGLSGPFADSANGKRLPQAPNFSGNLGLSYHYTTNGGDKLLAAVNVSRISSFYWNADNRVEQPGYNLLDASVAYTLRSTGVTVKVWGSNLTGSKYLTEEYESAGAQGDVGAPGAPRQVGVTASYSFR